MHSSNNINSSVFRYYYNNLKVNRLRNYINFTQWATAPADTTTNYNNNNKHIFNKLALAGRDNVYFVE